MTQARTQSEQGQVPEPFRYQPSERDPHVGDVIGPDGEVWFEQTDIGACRNVIERFSRIYWLGYRAGRAHARSVY